MAKGAKKAGLKPVADPWAPYGKYAIESAASTIRQAEQLKLDPKMMALVKPEIEKSIEADKNVLKTVKTATSPKKGKR